MESENNFQPFDTAILDGAGLNRQAVFNIAGLPEEMALSIGNKAGGNSACWRQIILIGHGGKKLWDSVRQSGIDSPDPIDDFTVLTVNKWFSACQPGNAFEIIYPGSQRVGLQAFGRLAGWHHASPFMVGVDRQWGSWYAYRALVVADTRFEPTRPADTESPCTGCAQRLCIGACPADALAGGSFDLGKCIAYRRLPDSRCKATCLARVACPVGSEHRYCDEQLRHTYSISLEMIERHCR